ncbi:TetR family transcriptional regulator [Erwinia sp. OLTSP20]|uniref:TetR/AcrR family transcriptional regulator n=1 Tax=unclassified Erwinia TaxID=2622719 RepID=UPI000C19E46D|nr:MULTISPECIES: TetR/AcrR family transcriptional regulator [unclassified Erwinia]PIJ50074.1 TetR family transcriptional regulator [Erwinia sp. OAMSP11]PIJ71944.1 TetR family transcriptional regulator [Erwinia sp. OLSSP12]PIJ80926.1 TetR family transcriptional regulator [Erwinia sp. OLCASP19]PIJ83831.1 TetR family transcriptional regulator [Erwinia sp. OLMTSP26]PIJ85989.1 TetR family transcriptional regulator [Erwinia sp. OLMDSP33]
MLADSQFDASAPARERILYQASALFYQAGIRATGIDRIIAEAGVTKVTFYRHFPSKQDLIIAFLQRRHQCWLAAFSAQLTEALAQGQSFDRALGTTLLSWFQEERFRGCAFINAAAELGNDNPQCMALVQMHKQQMYSEIASALRAQPQWVIQSVCMLVEGAIVQAQIGKNSEEVIKSLQQALKGLLAA